MRTLFVDRKNSALEVDSNRLKIHVSDQKRPGFSVPTRYLEMVVISCSVTLTSTVLTRLTEAGVTVVFINLRKSQYSAITHGLMHNDVTRRQLQYEIVSNQVMRQSIIRSLVKGKLISQRAMLARALKNRPDKRLVLTKELIELVVINLR